MTAPAATSAGPVRDVAVVDTLLAARARTTADVLAGLIATGMLQHVARPDRLPALLWPHVDPGTVQEVWDAALAVGYDAGTRRSRSRWDTDHLDAARDALHAAGYEAMGNLATGAAFAAPSRQPAPGEDA